MYEDARVVDAGIVVFVVVIVVAVVTLLPRHAAAPFHAVASRTHTVVVLCCVCVWRRATLASLSLKIYMAAGRGPRSGGLAGSPALSH